MFRYYFEKYPLEASSVLYGMIGAHLMPFVERYIFDDLDFVITLAVIMFCGALFNIAVAIRRKELSSDLFVEMLTKIIAYAGLLIITHSAATYAHKEPYDLLFDLIDRSMLSGLIAWEVLTAFRNAGILGIKIPRAVLRYLKGFDDDGSFDSEKLVSPKKTHTDETPSPGSNGLDRHTAPSDTDSHSRMRN